MTHDALCPWYGRYKPRAYPCDCQLIAKVRGDTLAAAVQRVESLPWTHENWIAWDERAAILAAIKAGQP